MIIKTTKCYILKTNYMYAKYLLLPLVSFCLEYMKLINGFVK